MGSEKCIRERGYFCQADEGIRGLVRFRGLGGVYKEQKLFTLITSGKRVAQGFEFTGKMKSDSTNRHAELFW